MNTLALFGRCRCGREQYRTHTYKFQKPKHNIGFNFSRLVFIFHTHIPPPPKTPPPPSGLSGYVHGLGLFLRLGLLARFASSPDAARLVTASPSSLRELERSCNFEQFELSKALYEAPNRCFFIKFDKFELSKALHEAPD